MKSARRWMSGRFTPRSGGVIVFVFLMGLSFGSSLKAAPPEHTPDSPERQTPMREITELGYRIQLDLSTQVLRLSVPEDLNYGGSPGKTEAAIAPTLTDFATDQFVSASVLAQKAKQFDDGLMAAVELAAEQGAGAYPGKVSILRGLARALTQPTGAPVSPASATILAACKLGGLDIDLPAAARQPVQAVVDEFLASDLRSKPISFYTWSEALSAIFQQDRMLQSELKGAAGVQAIVRGLHADPQSRAAYEGYLTLVTRLTNPPVYADLRRPLAELDRGALVVPSEGIYFFPPSRSHETELIKRLYGNRPIPEGFSLVDEMVRQIRGRRLSLRPSDASGWYDYQTWSLEPLVIPETMPEAKHLDFDPSYRKQLLELFKGILALTRETHIKQVEIPAVGAAAPSRRIEISPELSAEPLAAYYFRRAWSYFYVRWALEQTFGAPALAAMHRLTAAGPVQRSLAEELHGMEALFYGAHVTVCREIGQPPVTSPHVGSGKGTPADAAPLRAWKDGIGADPDVGQDARMMVPVFYDRAREKTKVWLFLGWASRSVEVDFEKPPAVTFLNHRGGDEGPGATPEVTFRSATYPLVYPVTAEVYVSKILNRDEFRAHCDKYKTRSAILANLP
jgi:hypothetical protein